MNLTIKAKFTLSIIIVGAFAAILIGAQSYISGEAAIRQSTFDRLDAVRAAKVSQIESLISRIENQVLTLAKNAFVVDTTEQLSDALLDEETLEGFDKAHNEEVSRFYQDEFIKTYNERSKTQQSAATFIPSDLITNFFQYHYMVKNPNPLGKKKLADRSPSDTSIYNSIHANVHPVLKDYMEKFAYDDIYLIEARKGYVVYSVNKDVEYGTSLTTGPHRDSGLASAFRSAVKIKNNQEYMQDFSAYAPAYGAAAGFIATPIRNGTRLVGVLAFRFPSQVIDSVMTSNKEWAKAGLGKTGETYIIAQDKTFRSNARQLLENKAAYLKNLETHNVSDDVRTKVDAYTSNILFQGIDTEAARAAAAGKSGNGILKNYFGKEVLAAYFPLNIHGFKWSVIAEIEAEEAFASTSELLKKIVYWSIGLVIAVLFFALYLGKQLTSPLLVAVDKLQLLSDAVAKGVGDLTTRFDASNADEIGQLNKAFNVFLETVEQMVNNVKNSAMKLAASSEEVATVVTTLASGAEQVASQSTDVASATEQMSNNINNIATAVEEMSANTNSVSGEAERMSTDMDTVTSGMKEMEIATQEISSNAGSANDISSEAIKQAVEASQIMSELGNAANEIGKVTDIIKQIAEKTNLLALNATIEAASAGEAGKGFAVVASEIKELATQSSNSAEVIASQISGIQDNATKAIGTIETVSEVIDKINKSINEITRSVGTQTQTAVGVSATVGGAHKGARNIAHAVAEIASGANDMSKNAGEAAKGVRNVSSNIQEVNKSANSSSSGIQEIDTSIKELSRLAGDLNKLVEGYKTA